MEEFMFSRNKGLFQQKTYFKYVTVSRVILVIMNNETCLLEIYKNILASRYLLNAPCPILRRYLTWLGDFNFRRYISKPYRNGQYFYVPIWSVNVIWISFSVTSKGLAYDPPNTKKNQKGLLPIHPLDHPISQNNDTTSRAIVKIYSSKITVLYHGLFS